MNARGLCPDDRALIEAARAVIATFKVSLDHQRLPPGQTAALRLLETALGPYEAQGGLTTLSRNMP